MREPRYRVRRSRGPLPSELLAVDATLAGPQVRVLKASARTTVAALTVAGVDVVLKRFRDTGLVHAIEVLVLGSRAARVWNGAANLRGAGFPAPEVLAVLEAPVVGVPVRSCAVTRWVAGVQLDERWRASAGAERRRLTLALADYLRALHEAGIYPQDLRAANVLVDGAMRFTLVDLDRVRRYRRLSWRRRRKNVVQVHRSVGRGAARTARLRFLRRYLGTPTRGELRRVVREILGESVRKDAEYARRRGEPPAERRRA